MARGSHVALKNSSAILWILLLFLDNSHGRKGDTYYMERNGDCGGSNSQLLSGATVLSHRAKKGKDIYSHNIECRITFKAERDDWKIMMKIQDLDIPDTSFGELCNDALYVYDAKNIMGRPVKEAGGNAGLCGRTLPPTIYSTGPYLTIYFRTDSSGPRGRGFKLVVTAYNEDYDKYQSCGQRFHCANNRCIDQDLTCDNVNHCGDASDELTLGRSQCGKMGKSNHNSHLTLRSKSCGKGQDPLVRGSIPESQERSQEWYDVFW